MIDATQSLLMRYEERRSKYSSQAGPPDEGARRAYRHAAAVLDCFDFSTLHPVLGQSQSDNPRALLFDDVMVSSGGASDRLYTLNLSLRKAVLRDLGSRQAMQAALAFNPGRPATDLQLLWENYLSTGLLPPLEQLRYRDLANVCQMLAWLDGLDPSLPRLEQAQDWLRRRSVFASFEHLVAENFTGREAELAMLRDHIGALPPRGGVEAAWLQLRAWLKLSPAPILSIYGVGGIGKSALIGRLLWEHAVADRDAQIPFAYLTFDQPSLRVDATFTILLEAAAQIELQYPEASSAIAAFRKAVLDFRDLRGALVNRGVVAQTRGERTGLALGYEENLHYEFATLLRSIGRREIDGSTVLAPVVLVFDTFEEVQYRDRESLSPFWRMLDRIQDQYPPLRVIVCGRAAVSAVTSPSRKLREESLIELDIPDRVALLAKLGVTEAGLAQAVAEQVGGIPLTLRLAARVISADPEAVSGKGISGLVTRRLLFFQLDEQIIQGQLYRRVLDHIHDDNVRRLAHPGMVLRRVDPDVILHVLAPLCLPCVTELAEAERIFNELRRESSLVTVDASDGALVYRPDTRRSLLRLLEQDRFDEVRRLRRSAIAYYALREDLNSRGEEMYHRLALGEDSADVLDDRWMEGLQSTLAGGLEDYSDTMKAWLASRMSLEVARSVYQRADTVEWERNTTRKVHVALIDGLVVSALKLLAERSDRSEASPLYALEAKVHLHRPTPAHLKRALEVLEAGILSVSQSTNRGRLAELLWLKAQVALMYATPDVVDADQSLARAQHAVERAHNPLPLMHILAQRLLLRRVHPQQAYTITNESLQQQLAAVCERMDSAQVYSAGFVAALAAEMLGSHLFPAVVQRLAQASLGKDRTPATPGALTSENLQGLDEYRHAWELFDASALQAIS